MNWSFVVTVVITVVALGGFYAAYRWIGALLVKPYTGQSREEKSLRGENQRRIDATKQQSKGFASSYEKFRGGPF